jgi:hypothetical protein
VVQGKEEVGGSDVTRKDEKGKAEGMITELMLVRNTAKKAAQDCS